jgi:hypothetical protein
MTVTVSTPLKLALVTTGVVSVVTLMRPESVELPASIGAPVVSSERAKVTAHGTNDEPKHPWLRPRLPELEMPKAESQSMAGTPPLPPPDTRLDDAATPALPPLPPTPSQPDMVYLGRIVTDEKAQVFFAANGEPIVLDEGGVLNGNWRVEAISPTGVTLRNLHSGETRIVATGGETGTHGATGNVAPVQVGPRFLGSPGAQITKQTTD